MIANNIILKSLRLVNFKEARNVDVSFSPDNSFVYGDNATGS